VRKYYIYKCSHGVPTNIPKVVEKYNIDFDLANRNGLKMGELAEEIYHELQTKMATLPFGHTIEAQAFGAEIKYDYINGNRVVGYPEKIRTPNCNDINMKMVFEAIEYLKSKDIPIMVNVSGPVSLATSILPTEKVYRGMAKDTEDVKILFSMIEEFLGAYVSKIMAMDVDIVSYADPSGTMDIIGERLYEKFAGISFLSVLKKVNSDNNTLVHICPKSASSLLAVGMIEEDEEGLISGGGCISDGINKVMNKRYRVK